MYLGHWIGYMPGKERMAISKLDLQGGAVRLLHRFSTLDPSLESAVVPDQGTTQVGAFKKLLALLDIRQNCQDAGFRCGRVSCSSPLILPDKFCL